MITVSIAITVRSEPHIMPAAGLRLGMTDAEIEKLIELKKSDFEYKEWLALKYAQDWIFLNGAEPQSAYMADYQAIIRKNKESIFTKSCG